MRMSLCRMGKLWMVYFDHIRGVYFGSGPKLGQVVERKGLQA